MTKEQDMILAREVALKPCPFCGGEALIVAETIVENEWYAACQKDQCAFVGYYKSPAAATTAWNTRS